MITRLIAIALLFCLAAPFVSTATAKETPPTRRFALIAASNEGGDGRATLRYAHSDAASVAKVLQELGGIHADDTLLLLGADRNSLNQAIARLAAKVDHEKSRSRVEVLMYYSGHSDETGLLLGQELFGWKELRSTLADLPADVRIAILDSCASGSLTRVKGGRVMAPFLVDTSSDVKGHAILTSSSADEVAQESDRIQASFFTHYLVSGLRGAADFSRDGRVTLNEAYQYAFHETLARTEGTRGGAQHAAYDINLSGAGDLVLTELRKGTAGLVFSDDIDGRIFVRDSRDVLVSEIRKYGGRPMELSLPPGTYRLFLQREAGAFESRVTLDEGKRTNVTATDFRATSLEATAWRGADASPGKPTDETKKYRTIPFSISVLPTVSTEGVEGDDVINNVSINLLAGHGARLHGVEMGWGLNSRSEVVTGAQLAIGGNFAGKGFWSDGGDRGDVYGTQLAVGFNAARGDLRGFQGSVGLNSAGGDVTGAQATVGVNTAGAVNGAQLSVGGNLAGVGEYEVTDATRQSYAGLQASVGFNLSRLDVRAGQLAVGVNIAEGDLRYAQLAVGANVAGGEVSGLQGAVGMNLAVEGFHGLQSAVGANIAPAGESAGLQAAAGGNVADRLTGVQAAAGFNHAAEIDGVQLGIVNVAGKVEGMQIGLINYADEITGVPIGLISIDRQTPVRFDLWTSDVHAANAGVRLGTKYVYNVIWAGLQPTDGKDRWALGYGIGGHLPIEDSFAVNLDVLGASEHYGGSWKSNNMLTTARLTLVWEPLERFSVFAGPTFNAYFSFAGDEFRDEEQSILPQREVWQDRSTRLKLWPGFTVGVRI